ncbi:MULTISPECIES: c-type cytochrome [Bradyrhizobium]|nr:MULTISPECIES: c-type cytochrome [Bradyrhizobium]MCS3730920.1 cytochrome c553 [Bradyrhizobium betae]
MLGTPWVEMHFPHALDGRQVAEKAIVLPVVIVCITLLFLALLYSGPARAFDGKNIAANGNGRDAPACSACHGEQGEGRPDAAYPRLAGLDSQYLVQQLNAFAEGKRDNETMHPIAKALTPDERQAVANFYAGLTTAVVAEPKKADDKAIAIGAALASRGDWSKGLPGCGQCHGAMGQGVGKTFPKLAGQSSEYITSQLKAWKDGTRTSDPLHLMTGIASKLDDKQVAAVAAYYATLPAAKPSTTPQGSKL